MFAVGGLMEQYLTWCGSVSPFSDGVVHSYFPTQILFSHELKQTWYRTTLNVIVRPAFRQNLRWNIKTDYKYLKPFKYMYSPVAMKYLSLMYFESLYK